MVVISVLSIIMNIVKRFTNLIPQKKGTRNHDRSPYKEPIMAPPHLGRYPSAATTKYLEILQKFTGSVIAKY